MLFSVVFIAVMLFYSVSLTLIVLASLPLYFGLSLVLVPILRARLNVKFTRGAENQIPPASAAQLPAVKGRVTLDSIVFGYRPEATPVLQGISLDVKPGEVICIVGRSGSGKSTLTKLVQRLYVPEGGRILVDGIDIGLIEAAQLRRQVGVVLQENLLFNRSVRENIAIADPAAPIDTVIHAARLAGAHDFISELPEGYDTVGEQGGSLSGGQRQRVAIARALFTNPRILIFGSHRGRCSDRSADADGDRARRRAGHG